MNQEEIKRMRRRIEAEIDDAKEALQVAAHNFAKAERNLCALQRTTCTHPNQTHRDGGWQGTADIYDCPDCGWHHVSD